MTQSTAHTELSSVSSCPLEPAHGVWCVERARFRRGQPYAGGGARKSRGGAAVPRRAAHLSPRLSTPALALSLLPPLVPEQPLPVITHPLLTLLSSVGKDDSPCPVLSRPAVPQRRPCHLPKWQEWYFATAQVLFCAVNVSSGVAPGGGKSTVGFITQSHHPFNSSQRGTWGLSFSWRWLFLLDSVPDLFFHFFLFLFFGGGKGSNPPAHTVQERERSPPRSPAQVLAKRGVGNRAAYPHTLQISPALSNSSSSQTPLYCSLAFLTIRILVGLTVLSQNFPLSSCFSSRNWGGHTATGLTDTDRHSAHACRHSAVVGARSWQEPAREQNPLVSRARSWAEAQQGRPGAPHTHVYPLHPAMHHSAAGASPRVWAAITQPHISSPSPMPIRLI